MMPRRRRPVTPRVDLKLPRPPLLATTRTLPPRHRRRAVIIRIFSVSAVDGIVPEPLMVPARIMTIPPPAAPLLIVPEELLREPEPPPPPHDQPVAAALVNAAPPYPPISVFACHVFLHDRQRPNCYHRLRLSSPGLRQCHRHFHRRRHCRVRARSTSIRIAFDTSVYYWSVVAS